MSTSKSRKFSDDAPKKSPSDDRLNYAPFAQRIANAIVGLDAPGGYVIGLHGKWGSGKSTVLNFVREYLAEHNATNDENRITVIDFRPWLITGDHDLIAAYFKVLSESLDNATKEKWWRAPSRLFRKDRSRLLADAATKTSLAVLDPSGTALVSKLALTAVSAASQLSKQMHESPSLQKAYKELHEKLRDSDRRFLVLIDDIDRLRDEDAKLIMQMVKSVGQLPNVIYLLTYDREIVWNTLGHQPTRTEPSFAEKIVQQELQLPIPSQTSLLKMLYEELSFLLEGTENSLRWEHIRQDGLRRWIQSPRDVVRLSNAVKFTWPALEGEIDPQDLLAMEGLRLFDFRVFEWLSNHRDYLFTKGRFQLAKEGLVAQTISILEDTVPKAKWPQIRELLIQLFPQMSKGLNETVLVSSLDSNEVRKRRGIGSEAGFDSYFGLYPSPDAIPPAVVNGIVSGIKTAETMEAYLRDCVRRKNSQDEPLIEELLDELSIRFRGLNPARPSQALLDALFAVGEEIADMDYRPGAGGRYPRLQIDLLIREMLCRWGPSESGMRLIDAFEKVESPAFLADIYVSRGCELGVFPADSREHCPITKDDFDKLGRILMAKIRSALNDKSLDQAPYYYNVARAWGHLASPDEPKSWLMEGVVRSGEFMAKTCLALVIDIVGGMGRHKFEAKDFIDPKLYDIETLLAAARAHQNSDALDDDSRYRIGAVALGCESQIANKNPSGEN